MKAVANECKLDKEQTQIITRGDLGHEFHPLIAMIHRNGPIPEYVLQDLFS
jgi:hypothetical protein